MSSISLNDCNSDTAEGWKRESGRRVGLAVSLGEVSRRDPGRPWSGGTIFRRQDNRGPASVELKYVGGGDGEESQENGGRNLGRPSMIKRMSQASPEAAGFGQDLFPCRLTEGKD